MRQSRATLGATAAASGRLGTGLPEAHSGTSVSSSPRSALSSGSLRHTWPSFSRSESLDLMGLPSSSCSLCGDPSEGGLCRRCWSVL